MALGPLMIDVTGLSLMPDEIELLQHSAIGGVIFFSKNYQNPEQFIKLVDSIKKLRSELILSVDQEGGRVQRFKTGLSVLPSMQSLAKSDDEVIEAIGCLMALEIRALGLDLSFAPVLDLDKNLSSIIANRAFSGDPHEVATLASAFGKGMLKAHMPRTGKHFPGHGAVKEDSHESLPIDARSWDKIEADLFPFVALIEDNLEIIMTAHIVYPEIDSLPASFSKIWLQDILRQKLGFEGIIISDDLAMGGAKGMGTYPQRVHAALSAGCDFVLICHQREAVLESILFLESNMAKYADYRRQFKMKPAIVNWAKLKQNQLYQDCTAVFAALESLS